MVTYLVTNGKNSFADITLQWRADSSAAAPVTLIATETGSAIYRIGTTSHWTGIRLQWPDTTSISTLLRSSANYPSNVPAETNAGTGASYSANPRLQNPRTLTFTKQGEDDIVLPWELDTNLSADSIVRDE